MARGQEKSPEKQGSFQIQGLEAWLGQKKMKHENLVDGRKGRTGQEPHPAPQQRATAHGTHTNFDGVTFPMERQR